MHSFYSAAEMACYWQSVSTLGQNEVRAGILWYIYAPLQQMIVTVRPHTHW